MKMAVQLTKEQKMYIVEHLNSGESNTKIARDVRCSEGSVRTYKFFKKTLVQKLSLKVRLIEISVDADKFSRDLTYIQADHAYYEYLLNEHTKERDSLDKQMRKLTGPFYKRMQQVLFDELKIKKEPYHGGALAGHACDQVC